MTVAGRVTGVGVVEGYSQILALLARVVEQRVSDFDMQGLSMTVDTQATYLRFGEELQLVAFPGETLTRNGLSIKDSMKSPYRVVLGNTGDALGYFVPSDEWMTGLNDDYEEGVSLGSDAGDRARDQIIPMIDLDNASF